MGRGPDDAHPTQRLGERRSDPDQLPPGTVVGEYRVVATIAVGGFGTVYRAEHTSVGRVVALKRLHRELTSSREAVLRFEREVEAVNTIRHANVIAINELGSHDGTPYFVMELLDGQDLLARLEAHGRLTLDETLRVLEPLCSALAAAHSRGIVHRDIKASNVFLHDGPEGPRVVLLDFGVAKLLENEGTSLTTSHHSVGTPACMAPEQIVGGEITTRTDVYGLAVLAYHMITGRLPFAGTDVTMMQQMHLDAERPRASWIVPGAAPVDAVLVKAMSRNPALRHSTVDAFLEELRAAAMPRDKVDTASSAAPAVGAYVTIHASAELLASPDARLLDEIDAVASAVADTLEPRGFEKLLDTGTTALYIRACELPDEPSAVRAELEGAVAALDARTDRDDRVTVFVALRSASVSELADLASWPAHEPPERIRVIR